MAHEPHFAETRTVALSVAFSMICIIRLHHLKCRIETNGDIAPLRRSHRTFSLIRPQVLLGVRFAKCVADAKCTYVYHIFEGMSVVKFSWADPVKNDFRKDNAMERSRCTHWRKLDDDRWKETRFQCKFQYIIINVSNWSRFRCNTFDLKSWIKKPCFSMLNKVYFQSRICRIAPRLCFCIQM